MNNLQVFENAQFGKVRSINRNGEVWFVGKDVAEALGYSNASKAVLIHIKENHRISEMMAHSQNGKMLNSTLTTLIDEAGLYSLILRSKLPQAEAFQEWVVSEVLPAIRKTGQYSVALKPATVAEVVSLVKVMRETMEAQGSAPEDVAKMVEGLGEQFNIKLPKFFVRPEKTTLNDVMDMIDFIYAHPRGRGKRIPTYEDFIVHMSVKLEPKEGSEKQCKGVDKYLRDAER